MNKKSVLSANHYIPTTSTKKMYCRPTIIFPRRQQKKVYCRPTIIFPRREEKSTFAFWKEGKTFPSLRSLFEKEGQDISFVPLRLAEIFKIRIFKNILVVGKPKIYFGKKIFRKIFSTSVMFFQLLIYFVYVCVSHTYSSCCSS